MGKLTLIAASVFFFFFVFVPIGFLTLTTLTGKTVPLLERLSRFELGRVYQETKENATPRYFKDLFTVRRYKKAARNSLLLAFVVATLATFLALPISLGFARRLLVLPKLFESLVLLPLVSPAFLYAMAFVFLLRDSFINPFSLWGLLLTQITAFIGLAVIVQTPALALYSQKWNLIAQSLGATSIFSAFRIWLPLNLPALLSAWILVALRSLADFVTPMILTSTRLRLIVLEAYRDLAGSNWWPGACALSLELLTIAVCLLVFEKWLLRKQRALAQFAPLSGFGEKKTPSPFLRILAAAYGALILCFPIVAACVILYNSWGGSQFSLSAFAEVWKEAQQPLLNSLILGLFVVVLAVGGSLFSVRVSRFRALRGFVGVGAMLAFAAPSTIYAIALVGIFNRPPIFIHFTPTLLILAILATRLNYPLQIINRSQERLGSSFEETVSVFGARPLFAFRWASWPYLKGAILASSILVFISSLQDVNISVLIAPPRFYPLSLVIVRNFADGLFLEASALGVILMALLLGVSSLSFGNLILSREAES